METGKERSERFVFLTKNERNALKLDNLTSKARGKLIEKLNRKLPELFVDLELMFESKTLEAWRDIKKRQNFSDFMKLSSLFTQLTNQNYKIFFVDKVRKIKIDGRTKYYVEEGDLDIFLAGLKNTRRDRRKTIRGVMYKEEFVLRGLKEKPKTRLILKMAFHYNKIPRDPMKALEINEIWKILPDVAKNELSKSKSNLF